MRPTEVGARLCRHGRLTGECDDWGEKLRSVHVLTHESIVGTTFTARVAERVGNAVVTEVEGAAFRTGEHRFVLDPRDPVGTGFVLR